MENCKKFGKAIEVTTSKKTFDKMFDMEVSYFKEKAGSISLKGIGLSEDDVANFMTNLEASPYYRNVRLKITKQKTEGGLRLQEFELLCNAEKSSTTVKK